MSIIDYLISSENIIAQSRRHYGIQRCDAAVFVIVAALRTGSPLLVCGNGGSAADAMHISGELVGRFRRDRQAFNCICLSSNHAVLTAWANDHSFDTVFSRQVEAYGKSGAALLGISTSGNSRNVIEAFKTALSLNMTTIALTGEGGGKLADLADILIDVPTCSTPLVQQVHTCLYHYICDRVEEELAASSNAEFPVHAELPMYP